MNRYGLSLRFISLPILLVGVVALVSACFGGYAAEVPTMSELEDPPEEIDVETLYSYYITDEETAGSIYKGKRFLFTNITVEKIESVVLDPKHAGDTYIMYDSVKFRAQYPNDLDYYKEGFIVEVVGEVQGMQFGDILVIKNCWFKVVEGDLATTALPVY